MDCSRRLRAATSAEDPGLAACAIVELSGTLSAK
jgi:hypothetical protein